MCTLTAIPFSSGGFRLVFNRDEQRARAVGLPPVLRRCGRTALMPLDPAGGGTWIAANDAGLAVGLLNLNEDATVPLPPPSVLRGRAGEGAMTKSRGSIIPSLMGEDSVESAVHFAKNLTPWDFLPFRLILLDGRHVAIVRSNGKSLAIEMTPYDRSPMLWTSSGLGDALVEQPRRELFDERFRADGDWLEAQDGFHRHQWPDRLHLSVLMGRDDAATVGRTTVEVIENAVTMRHQFIPEATEETTHTLRRIGVRAA